MEKLEIPRRTLYRLSIYLRCLQRLKNEGVDTISSEALAQDAGVKPTQLRKDLGHVGQFGTRGLGYSVTTLHEAIAGAMGMTRLQPVVLVGVGNLGAALLHYGGFKKEGFDIIAAFDIDPDGARGRVGEEHTPVHNVSELEKYIRSHEVKMAILAVPAEGANEVATTIVKAGVEAILNFSPTILQVPDEIMVNNVDLAAELESLRFFVS